MNKFKNNNKTKINFLKRLKIKEKYGKMKPCGKNWQKP